MMNTVESLKAEISTTKQDRDWSEVHLLFSRVLANQTTIMEALSDGDPPANPLFNKVKPCDACEGTGKRFNIR